MSKYIQVIETRDMQGAIKSLSPDVRSIVDMFSFYVARAKIQGNNIGKIIVIFSDGGKNEELLDVVLIKTKKELNCKELNSLPIAEARKAYLSKIYNEILSLFKDNNLTLVSLEQVIYLIKSKNYIFEEQWKSKWSPSKKVQASIRWLYTDSIYFYLDIYNKDEKTTESISITVAAPGLGSVELCLGELKWKSNNIVLLYQNNKRDYWEIDIETKEVNFFYQPAISGNPHGQYNLALNYLEGELGLPKDIEKAKYWLNKSAEQGFNKSIKLLEEMNSIKK